MMQEANYLEQLPQAALEIRDGTVCAMNAAAQQQLPQLNQGAPVPAFLAQSLAAGQSAGSFAQGDATFLFTRVSSPTSELILFRPAQGCAITGQNLEGFSRQMREKMGGLLNQIQILSNQLVQQPESTAHLTGVNHSFHQVLRLVNNLEFLNVPEQEAQALFRPVTMDLAGLCLQLVRQAAPMLRKAGVGLEYASQCTGLLIPGSPELLQRMLLELISNAAKAAPDGVVTLDLQPWRDRAVLTVTDSGSAKPVDLAVLLQGETLEDIPSPGDGAGLGLSVVQRIVALHNGTLLTRQSGQGGLAFTVSLPVGPLAANVSLSSPSVETDAGISPFLLGLADLLPDQLFQLDVDG